MIQYWKGIGIVGHEKLSFKGYAFFLLLFFLLRFILLLVLVLKAEDRGLRQG